MTQLLQERPDETPGVKSGDEDVRQYVHEIRRYPLLTQEEERELAIRCAKGDDEALRQMVNSNLRLVVAIAREYAGRGVPLLDLIQEGSIGLITAAKKFDYTLEYRFSTYASKWIRQRITKSLMGEAGMIRVPHYTGEHMRKLTTAKAALQSETGREPSVEELALYTGFSQERVEELLMLSPEICSLDTPVGEDGENTMGTMLPGDEELEPQAVVIRQEMKQLLDELLARLDPRQQQILAMRFGMDGGECATLEEIGTKIGLSKERVRQIEKQAIRRLNKLGAELGLEAFLE